MVKYIRPHVNLLRLQDIRRIGHDKVKLAAREMRRVLKDVGLKEDRGWPVKPAMTRSVIIKE